MTKSDTTLSPQPPNIPQLKLSSLSTPPSQHRPRRRWLVRLINLLRLRLSLMRPRDLAATLWSLARMGIRPEPRWIDWALIECEARMDAFGPQVLLRVMILEKGQLGTSGGMRMGVMNVSGRGCCARGQRTEESERSN